MSIEPTSEEAKNAVNIFASVDVLGLLSDEGYYKGQTNDKGKPKTIEDGIKESYAALNKSDTTYQDYVKLAIKQDLQTWNTDKQRYEFSGIWNEVISRSGKKFPTLSSTSGVVEVLKNYVRLIGTRSDTVGWKISEGETKEIDGVTYMTSAYNLSVQAKQKQWLRWWGNSITPFSALQFVINKITNAGRPSLLMALGNQQNDVVVFNYPSGKVDDSEASYHTATSTAYSIMGQLSATASGKIQYDISFKIVDPQGDVIVQFQVDPEIVVI